MAADLLDFVPDTLEEVTPAWLAAVLDRPVAEATFEPLDAGIGFIGRTARVRLRTDPHDGGTGTVVVKLPGPEGPARTIGTSGAMYERECRFYAEAAPDVGIPVPEPIVVRMDLEQHRFALLLEDLAPARPGDQIAGASDDEVGAAVDVLARLHARWWARIDDSTLPWLPRPEQALAPIVAGAATGFADFAEAFASDLDDHHLRVAEQVSRRLPALLARAPDGPHTLVHGDYRLDNLLFRPDGTIVVADWQLVQAAPDGASDLALLLASSLDGAQRARLVRPLLDRYLVGLAAEGVEINAGALDRAMQRAAGVCVGRMMTAFRIPSANDRARQMRERMYAGYWDLADAFDLEAALRSV